MANPITYAGKIVRKLGDKWWLARAKYISYYDKLPLDDKCILIESQHGKEMNGNVFYILKYLSESEKYKDYKLYLTVTASRIPEFEKMIAFYGLKNIKLTMLASKEYFRILASAKYLINDNTFLPFYLKKEGQVYMNTWHGTPLKTLGKTIINDAHAIGNTQKNFVCADYMLFPNDHTRDALVNDYMLSNIARGQYVMAGYPRNEVFFHEGRKAEIVEALGLQGKKLYAYMPTYRGVARNAGGQSEHDLQEYLAQIDGLLQDDEILYMNLHPIAKKDVDFSLYTHIRNFPEEYETYDFLSAADALVTDYSSVFFDFACSRRKIVLFTYDKEEYLRDRGMYMSMDELPFPQVCTPKALLQELRTGKNYDDEAFLARFSKYECANASQKLCDFMILGSSDLKPLPYPSNGKENVLMYIGNLAGNGITASARYLLQSIDLTKRNYYFSFYTDYVGRFREAIRTFPDQANYFAVAGDANTTLYDRVWRKLFHMRWLKADDYMRRQGHRVRQEFLREYGGAKFDHVIQFSGYEEHTIFNYSAFNGRRTIYVHSDMVKEMENRGNQRRDVLEYAYRNYDKVAVVTQDIKQSTVSISQREDNLVVTRNLIGYKTILEKAEAPIALDENTKCTVSEERLKEILLSDAECFINVGRFSPEKGHDRLVDAFAAYSKKNPGGYLLILGGSSMNDGYDVLWEKVTAMGMQDNVILIERVGNPYPIVKACDYFVLSSHYEGFGLVLVEADILGLSAISTDITGPRGFMQKYGGTMVENSTAGLIAGMEMLHAGKVKPMHVDYDQYNAEAIAAFESLFA
jgi:CDP-glycerol glycerophosphotransferase